MRHDTISKADAARRGSERRKRIAASSAEEVVDVEDVGVHVVDGRCPSSGLSTHRGKTAIKVVRTWLVVHVIRATTNDVACNTRSRRLSLKPVIMSGQLFLDSQAIASKLFQTFEFKFQIEKPSGVLNKSTPLAG